MTNVINGVTAAVAIGAATSFTVAEGSIKVVIADGFAVGESAMIWRLGPSGSYVAATNKDGAMTLSNIPNMLILDVQGTYKVTKTATAEAAYVGYL